MDLLSEAVSHIPGINEEKLVSIPSPTGFPFEVSRLNSAGYALPPPAGQPIQVQAATTTSFDGKSATSVVVIATKEM
jgi:hypothetical protein